ncbi:MAG: cupin domain-containing protein [Desulfovibrio sp.]|jgi:ethanolamine utilization protein EutQ|nr:cupin domain-containing protein [Desulfovibrio sp.]
MKGIDEKNLESLVRKALADILAENGGALAGPKHVDKSGIMSVHLPAIRPELFDTGKPGAGVLVKDIPTLEESPRLGFGVMEMDHTAFEWTLNYDEVDYVINGTLEILIDGRKVCGQAGDLIFIPAGSAIQFSAPGKVRFLYVVYPANWSEQN